MATSNEQLGALVVAASVPVYRQSKAEIVAYYSKTYPRNWQTQLARDLEPIAGVKARNLQRRFNPDRVGNAPRRAAEREQYVQLGQQLPPRGYRPPPQGYRIRWRGTFTISGDKKTPRNNHGLQDYQHFAGKQAADLLLEPDVETLLENYFDDASIVDSYAVTVESVAAW